MTEVDARHSEAMALVDAMRALLGTGPSHGAAEGTLVLLDKLRDVADRLYGAVLDAEATGVTPQTAPDAVLADWRAAGHATA